MFAKFKKREVNKKEKCDAKYVSTNAIVSRIMVIAIALVVMFSAVDITITKVKAIGGGGADAEVLSSGMYELSQSVATGSWFLVETAKSYTGSESDKKSMYYINDTFQFDVTSQNTDVYKLNDTADADSNQKTYIYTNLTTYSNGNSYSSQAWAPAANLIGMYNAYGLTGDNGNTGISLPGTNSAQNEYGWDLNSVLTGYARGVGGTYTVSGIDAAIARYWFFGRSLTDAGILEYATAKGSTSSSLRPIFGYGTYATYIMATTANGVFKTCINLAAQLDIVNVLEKNADGKAYNIDNKIMNAINGSHFMETITDVYIAVRAARLAILFLFVIVLVLNFTLFKPLTSYSAAEQRRAKIIKFMSRCFIMFAGVPLLAWAYHMCLYTAVNGGLSNVHSSFDNTMNISQSTQITGTDKIKMQTEKVVGGSTDDSIMADKLINAYVMSTFIDMQYIMDNNFQLPDGTTLELKYHYYPETKKLQVTGANRLSTLAYNLNGFEGEAALDSSLFKGVGEDDNSTNQAISNIENFNVSYLYQGYDQKGNKLEPKTDTSGRTIDANTVRQLLISYADGERLDLSVGAGNISDYNAYIAQQVIRPAFTDPEKANANFGNFAQTVNSDLMLLFAISPSYKFGEADEFIIAGDDDSGKIYMKGKGDNYGLFGLSGVPMYANDTPFSLYGALLKTPVDKSNAIQSLSGAPGSAYTITLPKALKYNTNNKNAVITITYDKGVYFSQLGKYNFIHTAFTPDGFTVYDPNITVNDATGYSMYKVGLVYSDVQEIAQVIYLNAILLSFGLLGWVFGLTTMANILVEFFQLVPSLFKTMFGSAKGFAHAAAVVLTIVFELLATIAVYTYSIQFIDFVIRFVGALLALFNDNVNTTTTNLGGIITVLACLIISALLLWAVSLLVKFRKAIVLWFTGLVKSAVNMAFRVLGFNDVDISNANVGNANNSKLAMAGAAMVAGGALAASGDLSDIAGQLGNSKLGKQFGENLGDNVGDAVQALSTGDVKGAAKELTSGLMDDTPFEDAGGLFNQDTESSTTQATTGANDTIEGATDTAVNGGDGSGNGTSPEAQAGTVGTEGADGVAGTADDTAPTVLSTPGAVQTSAGGIDQATQEAIGKMNMPWQNSNAGMASHITNAQGEQIKSHPLGLTDEQDQIIQDMASSGADYSDIATTVADFQADNFGSVQNANAYLAAANPKGQQAGKAYSYTGADGTTQQMTIATSNNGTDQAGVTGASITTSGGDAMNYQIGSYGGGGTAGAPAASGQQTLSQLMTESTGGSVTYNASATASYQKDATVNGGAIVNGERYTVDSSYGGAGFNDASSLVQAPTEYGDNGEHVVNYAPQQDVTQQATTVMDGLMNGLTGNGFADMDTSGYGDAAKDVPTDGVTDFGYGSVDQS